MNNFPPEPARVVAERQRLVGLKLVLVGLDEQHALAVQSPVVHRHALTEQLEQHGREPLRRRQHIDDRAALDPVLDEIAEAGDELII